MTIERVGTESPRIQSREHTQVDTRPASSEAPATSQRSLPPGWDGHSDFQAASTNKVSGAGPADLPPPSSIPEWSPEVGKAVSQENFWNESLNGEPSARQKAMEEWAQLPAERRREIFEQSMDEGLTAEGITDPGERERWKNAMRDVVIGGGRIPPHKAENGDLNPFMIAGESGGKFRGGPSVLNSTAMGYFQFLAQNGQGQTSEEWQKFAPPGAQLSQQTDPVMQVRQFIRSVNEGAHAGNPDSVVDQKVRQGWWSPWSR
jgi:hypothetical protein